MSTNYNPLDQGKAFNESTQFSDTAQDISMQDSLDALKQLDALVDQTRQDIEKGN